MGPEASRRFVELLESERELLLLQHEYWSQAVRDSKLRARYASQRAELRAAFGRAISTRLEHLGAPPGAVEVETMATVIMALSAGLAEERLIDPGAVPDGLLGETIVLLYFGVVAARQIRSVYLTVHELDRPGAAHKISSPRLHDGMREAGWHAHGIQIRLRRPPEGLEELSPGRA